MRRLPAPSAGFQLPSTIEPETKPPSFVNRNANFPVKVKGGIASCGLAFSPSFLRYSPSPISTSNSPPPAESLHSWRAKASISSGAQPFRRLPGPVQEEFRGLRVHAVGAHAQHFFDGWQEQEEEGEKGGQEEHEFQAQLALAFFPGVGGVHGNPEFLEALI
ncbi:MAG: hypothetical protein J4203_01295 [Candidatus Diapherotrites archaeon]|uniref:Uncharacterized protein n=1 Tax=Candidatus Iainarchaeum sp. TaxID=3101447 RepID=A0A8T4L5A9_9ARCH|nr:hypothetical protein [Candidatus Diapherotrites archaeon]